MIDRESTTTAALPAIEAARGEDLAAGRRVVGGGLWSAASASVPLVGTAILSVVMGRILGPDLLGRQSLIVYVEALLTAFVLGSFSDASVRAMAAAGQDSVDAGQLVTWAVRGHAVAGAIVAAALVGIGVAQPADRGLWWIVAACAALNAAGWALGVRWIAFDGWAAVGRWRLVSQSASALLGIASVVAGFGIAGVLWSNAAAAVLLYVLLSRHVPGPKMSRRPGPLPRPLLRLWGSFAAAETLTQVVTQRIEFVFLGLLSTDAAVAQYSVPFALVLAATTAPVGVIMTAIPVVARASGGDPRRMSDQLGRVGRVVGVTSVLLVAALVALGPLLVRLVYGRDFLQAARLVPLLALSALVSPVGRLYNAYWAGLGRMRGPLVCGAIGGALDVGLALALIPGHGAAGAAVANVCGQGSTSILLMGYTWRRAGRFGLGTTKLATVGCWSAVAVALAWVVTRHRADWLGLVVSGVLFAAVLLVGGRRAGYVGGADAAWLRRVLPQRLVFAVSWVAGRTPRQPPALAAGAPAGAGAAAAGGRSRPARAVVIADIESWEGFSRFGAVLRSRDVAVLRFTGRPRGRSEWVRSRLQRFVLPDTEYGLAWSGRGQLPRLGPLRDRLGTAVLAVEATDHVAAAMLDAGILHQRLRRTSGPAVAETVLYDKLAMTRHVRSVGGRVPATWVDQAAVSRRSRVVLKLRLGSGGQGVRIVDGRPEDVGQAWLAMSDDPARVFAQEFVAGETVHVGGVALDGRALVVGAYRSRTARGDQLGPVASVEILDDGPLLASAATIVASLGYTGAFNIDFVRDDGGDALFVDFNSRVFGSWLALQRAGMDFLGAYLFAYGLAARFRRGSPTAGTVVSALATTAVNNPGAPLLRTLGRSLRQTFGDGRVLGGRWLCVALTETAGATALRLARRAARPRLGEPGAPGGPARGPSLLSTGPE